jgi:tRNA A37 threonylcarbamoyladenosine biosynthesis protein TsaE
MGWTQTALNREMVNSLYKVLGAGHISFLQGQMEAAMVLEGKAPYPAYQIIGAWNMSIFKVNSTSAPLKGIHRNGYY